MPFEQHGWSQRILYLVKLVRQRQILYDITYMWNLKILQMDLYTKQKQTHGHGKQSFGYLREEDLLYSTQINTQYLIINYDGI